MNFNGFPGLGKKKDEEGKKNNKAAIAVAAALGGMAAAGGTAYVVNEAHTQAQAAENQEVVKEVIEDVNETLVNNRVADIEAGVNDPIPGNVEGNEGGALERQAEAKAAVEMRDANVAKARDEHAPVSIPADHAAKMDQE